MKLFKILKNSEIFKNIDLYFALFISKNEQEYKDEIFLICAFTSYFNREYGHICISVDFLEKSFSQLIPCSDYEFPDKERLLQVLNNSINVCSQKTKTPIVFFNNNIYIRRFYEYEQNIIKRIKELKNSSLSIDHTYVKLLNILFDTHSEENNWQKIAAFLCCTNNFSVITGGPGTGKTTTVGKILCLLLEKSNDIKIAICAPTGKAASRLTESILKVKRTLRDISDISSDIIDKIPSEASTIQRLLGVIYRTPDFKKNKDNKLEYDVIIVDEASMIDLPLMSKLLDACHNNSKIIFLGDKDQLASVEIGAVFGDICSIDNIDNFSDEFTKILEINTGENLVHKKEENIFKNSIVQLKKTYRFGDQGEVADLCRLINNMDFENTKRTLEKNSKVIKWNSFSEYEVFFKELKKRAKIGFSSFFDNVKKYQNNISEEELENIFDSFTKYSILCAFSKGYTGADHINKQISKMMAPNSNTQYFHGLPLMILKNDYSLGLFNGDIGIVLRVEGLLKVFFKNPDGSYRTLNITRLPEHKICYAITIHKSQGSEFNKALIVFPDIDSPVLTKELLYTGVTRVKDGVELWCDENILKTILSRKIKRFSGF